MTQMISARDSAPGRRVRLGMLTPSSNTVLEPLTTAMLADLPGCGGPELGGPEVTAHFARFRVTEIALSADALAQFDDSAILAAAELLSHARVDAIVWNGTSSGWLGFDADRRLCERIVARTGIPAGTAMLALNDRLSAFGVRRLGLVTPYLPDVQARIIANYRGLGIDCVSERHLGIQDNFKFAEVPPARLAAQVRAVAAARPDAIAITCTNLRAASLVAALEAELDVPILDTVATALWGALRLAGVDASRIRGWGRLFAEA